MKKLLATTVLGLTIGLLSPASHAVLMSVSGPESTIDPLGTPVSGGLATIIAAPSDVTDDAESNTAQQGFNEMLGVTLAAALDVDGPTDIAAGTTVDSHMIFLNSGPGNDTTRISHFNVNWTFDGLILGVMSNYEGSLEVASSSELGAMDTLYPQAIFNARGLEQNDGVGDGPNDGYSIIDPNTLQVGMLVTEPGDWIRVITATVPEPSIIALFGLGLLGLGFARRKVPS